MSSTVFGHVASDQVFQHMGTLLLTQLVTGWLSGTQQHVSSHHGVQVLRPLGHFATAETRALYPEITAGGFVQQELESIRLLKA